MARHAPRGRGPTPAAAVLAAAVAIGAGAVADTGDAAPPTCHGLPVTVAEHGGVVHGTPGPDVIKLTRPGTAFGGRGRDVICGSTGRDRLFPGGGDDVVLAGPGADVVRGGAGRDRLFGEAGDDQIAGGPGRDTIVSGDGDDTVTRGAPAGLHGQAARPAEDTIAFNRFAASVLIDARVLDRLRDEGMGLSFFRSMTSSGRRASTPVWATTAGPLASNVLTWPDGRYRVFSSSDRPLPGAVIEADASTPAAPGSAWAVSPDGVILGAGGFRDGLIAMANRGGPAITTGLAQAWTLNGETASAPLGATALPSGGSTVLGAPPTISVAVTADAQTAQVIGLPENLATARLSAARPTATFLWSSTRGGFTTPAPAVPTG